MSRIEAMTPRSKVFGGSFSISP